MSFGYQLRPATANDQAPIRTLIRSYGLNPFGLHWVHFTVAEERETGRFLGCVQIKSHGDGSRELASLAVVADQQGQGLGGHLIHHLQRIEPPPLWLMCASRLIPYYQRFGFRHINQRRHMPPYFRRMALIFAPFSWLSRIFGAGNQLAIMCWQ